MGNCKKIMGIIIIIMLSQISVAKSQNIDVDIIARIESNNTPEAFNVHEKAVGAHQIRLPAVKDYNTFGPGRSHPLSHIDMFDPFISSVVCDWYVNVRIPAMLRHYKVRDSDLMRLVAYNAGIKYTLPGARIPLSTINYIEKYKTLKEVIKNVEGLI